MDQSVASLNRSTFEERQKNVTYLRSLYFLLALQLLVAVGWSILTIWCDTLGEWVRVWWGIALGCGIVALLLLLAVYFVPALNNGGGAGIGIYALFTLCAAYVWGYWCAWDRDAGYGWYVLILLTAIAGGFAAYTWYSPLTQGFFDLPPDAGLRRHRGRRLPHRVHPFPDLHQHTLLLDDHDRVPRDDLRLLLELRCEENGRLVSPR